MKEKKEAALSKKRETAFTWEKEDAYEIRFFGASIFTKKGGGIVNRQNKLKQFRHPAGSAGGDGIAESATEARRPSRVPKWMYFFCTP